MADHFNILDQPAGGSGSALVVRLARITSGDITLANTSGSWAAVPGVELSLPASVGHLVELEPSMMFHPVGGVPLLDLAVISGSTLARFASSGTGTPAVEGDPTLYPDPSGYRTIGGLFTFTVGSGDLDGSNVRFVVATKGTGGGTLYASTNYPLRWKATNYGVVS